MNFAANLTPYPFYKPSGVDWLGDVPAHWEVVRLKSISRFAYGDSLPAEARTNGSVPVFGSNGVVGSHSFSNTSPPCLIIGRKGSFGKVHYSPDPAFAIDTTFYVDKRTTDANIRWLYYLLCSLNLDSFSRDSAVPGLSRGDAYGRIGPLPPLPEQRAIARYLDHADRRIQRHIQATQKSITLLHEARQATIQRAVTRGLNPNVPLKPSGVEWLGDVPAHWDVAELGRIGRFSKGSGGTKADEVPEGIPCIRYGDLYTSHKYHIRASRSFVTEIDAPNYTPIRYRDILFAGSGETIEEIGKSAVNLIEKPACCGGDVILFRPEREMDATFSGYAIDCPQSQYQKSCMGRGITIMHIYGGELKYLWIALPPLAEQTAIAAYLNKATAAIDAAIDTARRQTENMQEYRASLIAHVVTGKLDVRAAAERIGMATS